MAGEANTLPKESEIATVPTLEPRLLAQSLGFRYLEQLPDPAPPSELIRGDFDRIMGSWAKNCLTIPIGGNENSILVATADPLNIQAIDQLRSCYGKPIELVVTSAEEIARSINVIRTKLMQGRSSELSQKDDKESNYEDLQAQLKIDVTDAEDDDAPIIRYVNAIIFKASSERASDVHIEPFEEHLKVRFRIDGVLKDVAREDRTFQAAILSRIKIMAGLNIAEKRLPQDGRIGLKIAGKDVDIRVSSIPTQFGERIVMRLLDKSAVLLDLEQVGLRGKTLERVLQLINKPHGILLITGPTGSGKTTTLYSCLTRINTPDLNILTIEDPIEYQLDGVGQMQVSTKIGFTFANGLRSILRQDPDVVMVGEIRDAETAEIAVQASLTGHLVLSTLHTNDSAGAITRLIDMGIEPFLVSSSLLGVMAQRLIRLLCPHCKKAYELSEEELLELGLDPKLVKKRVAFQASTEGCKTCQNTGYKGRAGIHELLLINDDIRSLILQRADTSTIKSKAKLFEFQTLREDGASKILDGITSVEEVLRVTLEDIS